MNVSSTHRMLMETRLRRALERGDLQIFYQPQVRVSDGSATGVEALLRWNDPELGSVSPAEFIDVAEEIGFIEPIGEWVLQTACEQTARWREMGVELKLAVNLSPHQLIPWLPKMVEHVLRLTGLEASSLELEITESALMRNEQVAIGVLEDLKALGVRLALDDFGVGFSSLSHLKRFPADTIKIDRSFIDGVTSDPGDQAITQAILHMARVLGLRVVAEGVETLEQLDFLRENDCAELQGWLFSEAVPAERIPSLIVELRGDSPD